jgi:hypothetical protein
MFFTLSLLLCGESAALLLLLLQSMEFICSNRLLLWSLADFEVSPQLVNCS